MIFVLAALVAVFFFLALGLTKMQTRAYQITNLSWPEVSRQIVPVNDQGIDAVALDHLKIDEPRTPRTHDEIWELVGGADGLEGMRRNSQAFIVLASKTLAEEGPHSPKAAFITEQMQSNAEDLNRAVLNFSLSKTIGYRKQRGTLYLRQAAAAYYLIRTRFFSIYKASGRVDRSMPIYQ